MALSGEFMTLAPFMPSACCYRPVDASDEIETEGVPVIPASRVGIPSTVKSLPHGALVDPNVNEFPISNNNAEFRQPNIGYARKLGCAFFGVKS
jgi:hypothetical protein